MSSTSPAGLTFAGIRVYYLVSGPDGLGEMTYTDVPVSEGMTTEGALLRAKEQLQAFYPGETVLRMLRATNLYS